MRHTIEAAPGEPISEGFRYGFQGWTDGAPRVREFTTQLEDATFVAEYGGREVQLDVELVSPVPGILPGAVEFNPGDLFGWVAEGETVSLQALPLTGFGFREWTGDLAGEPNPTTLVASMPLEAGALFDLTFSTASNSPTVEVEASKTYVLSLVVDNANPPVSWTLTSGELPEGMTLDQVGKIQGVAMDKGTYPLTLHVMDGIGLKGDLVMDLEVVDPVIPLEQLASAFLLTGLDLELNQRIYLDRAGNRNGSYDLGDFRAFILANPDLPMSAEMRAVVELLVPLGEMEGVSSRTDVRKEGRIR
ncbi:putative Ig domain-containing protein [Gemmatimonadota bacterium]